MCAVKQKTKQQMITPKFKTDPMATIEVILNKRLSGVISSDEILALQNELIAAFEKKKRGYYIKYIGGPTQGEYVESENPITAYKEFEIKYPYRIIEEVIDFN